MKDRTEVVECLPPSRLVLRAHLWPLGSFVVRFALTPVGEDATRVTIAGEFGAGAMRWLRTER